MLRHFLTFTLALTTQAVLHAQGYFDVRTDLIDSADVMASTAIWDITIVVPIDALPTPSNEPTLNGVCSVSDAVKAGLPSSEMDEVLTRLLGTRHVKNLRSATLEDYYDKGFAWTITWALFPETGGFSGVPFKWKAVVTHDGRVIAPRLFLQSHFENYFEPEKTVFCTLPMSDLTSAPASLSGRKLEQAKKLASSRLHAAFREAGYTNRFRIAEVGPKQYPGSILGVGDRHDEVVAWSLQFVELEPEDGSPIEFTVWADDRGQIGKFTIGGWEPKFGEPSDAPESASRSPSKMEDQPRGPGDQ